jgi:hypothetical protein
MSQLPLQLPLQLPVPRPLLLLLLPTIMARPSITEGMPSMMNSHCNKTSRRQRHCTQAPNRQRINTLTSTHQTHHKHCLLCSGMLEIHHIAVLQQHIKHVLLHVLPHTASRLHMHIHVL